MLELVSEARSSSAFIYPFSADVDTTSIGHVFYRQSTDMEVLSRINSYSNMVFEGTTNLTHVFIATWFYVGYYDNHDDRVSLYMHANVSDYTPLSLPPPPYLTPPSHLLFLSLYIACSFP